MAYDQHNHNPSQQRQMKCIIIKNWVSKKKGVQKLSCSGEKNKTNLNRLCYRGELYSERYIGFLCERLNEERIEFFGVGKKGNR